jgi:hypothetical protein
MKNIIPFSKILRKESDCFMLTHNGNNVLTWSGKAADKNNWFYGNYNTGLLDFDPLITGYSFFKWTVLPQWFANRFPNFAEMTEKNFLEGFSLSDIELETSTISAGFAGNEYNVATTIKKGNTDFSIKHREFSGSPIRNMYQYWITGIRDPETGISTYGAAEGIIYGAKNHTGEICYIVTRPDANNTSTTNIEFACYYTAVMPKKIQLSQFSFSHGSHDLVEYDQNFVGCFHMGKYVDVFARNALKANSYGFLELNGYKPDTTPTATGIPVSISYKTDSVINAHDESVIPDSRAGATPQGYSST